MKKFIILFCLVLSWDVNALSITKPRRTKLVHHGGFEFYCTKPARLGYYPVLVRKTLALYQSRFVDASIKQVVICRRIRLARPLHSPHDPCGLYDPWAKVIYLRQSRMFRAFIDTIHHEVSSFILRDFCKRTTDDCKAFKRRWAALNKTPYMPDWRKAPEDIYFWWDKGFISKYAMSNLENDFNVTAEFLTQKRYRKKFLEKRHVFHDAHISKFNILTDIYQDYLAPESYQQMTEWKTAPTPKDEASDE